MFGLDTNIAAFTDVDSLNFVIRNVSFFIAGIKRHIGKFRKLFRLSKRRPIYLKSGQFLHALPFFLYFLQHFFLLAFIFFISNLFAILGLGLKRQDIINTCRFNFPKTDEFIVQLAVHF